MEPEPITPDAEQPPAPTNRYKKYALLLLPLFLITLLVIGIAYLLKPDSPAPSPSQPQSTNRTSLAPPKPELVLFARGLPNTTAIVSRPDDSRLFVLDQDGFIRLVNSDGSVIPTPFLDIRSLVLSGGEMGLLGMAFSPNYSKDGYFFINYIDRNQNTIIARFRTVSADKADPASESKVLSVQQPYTNHNGGALVFGSDGYLYVALGDGGSGGDPQNRAQNLSSIFGKILRIDVSQIPYKIPASNPFVNQADRRAEIWDYGLRNPWRINFDRQTRELYIADVGQGDFEEVNIESANKGGNNYGWRCFEGDHDFNLGGCGQKSQYIFPALEYDHSEERCSITGGYVYRGKQFPALSGLYFYGDYCGGQLYFAKKQDTKLAPTLVTKTSYQISTFGEDSQGELYLADYTGGAIYKIKDTAN